MSNITLKTGTKVFLIQISPDPFIMSDKLIGCILSEKDIIFESIEVNKYIVNYKIVQCHHSYKEPKPKWNGFVIDCISWDRSTTTKQKIKYVTDYIVNDILEFNISDWIKSKYDILMFNYTSRVKNEKNKST